MKINGKKISERNIVLTVFPRPSGPLAFKTAAVLDDAEFDKAVKRPDPPTITKPGKDPVPDFEDPKFREAMGGYFKLKDDWTFITSLGATEGLEWESVKLSDPETWEKWRDELKGAGLSLYEIRMLIAATNEANSLDDAKLEEARKSFLRSQVAPAAQ